MDKTQFWCWYPSKPIMRLTCWNMDADDYDFTTDNRNSVILSDIFDIAPASDWTKSLIKIERK